MKPFELGRWHLPAGTRIVCEATVMHGDERFHANAGDFEPDRYVGEKPDTYSWIPFWPACGAASAPRSRSSRWMS